MRITKEQTQYDDIMWFAVDIEGNIIECTSGVYGNIPEFVCSSRENTEILMKYFTEELDKRTRANILQGNDFGNELIEECRLLSEKGIFCFDAYDGVSHTIHYTKISEPENAIKISDLPIEIQKILVNNRLEVNINELSLLKVDNAY